MKSSLLNGLSELNINPDNWKDLRGEIFERARKKNPSPVELELLFKELSQRLSVSVTAVKQDWQAYLNGDQEAPLGNGAGAASALLSILNGLDIELWRTTNREAYASVSVPNEWPRGSFHEEHLPLDSNEFREWLGITYTNITQGGVLRDDTISDVIRVLKAKARRGRVFELFTRVGWHNGRVYVDLRTPDGRVVEIGPAGFKVLHAEASPVRFRWDPHQLPLPIPKPSQDGLFRLLEAFGITDENRRLKVKVLSWLVGAYLPRGPYPILIIEGEKGAGKSTLARLLKRLVDPTKARLQSPPRDEENLMVSALRNHVLAFDNLSGVAPLFSDALARLSTGGSLVRRKLYTDFEVTVVDATRPIILTGISLGILRDDLMDRAVRIELRRLDGPARATERELEEKLEELLPEALGHLFWAVSQALQNYEAARERLESAGALPRMGDWAVWVEAAAPAFGLEAGEALRAYTDTQTAYNTEVLDADPLAQNIVALYDEGLKPGETRVYTAGELLKALEERLPQDRAQWPKEWPRNPVGLGKRLPRLAGALREAGVHIEQRLNERQNNKVWVLSKPIEGVIEAEKAPGRGPEPVDEAPTPASSVEEGARPTVLEGAAPTPKPANTEKTKTASEGPFPLMSLVELLKTLAGRGVVFKVLRGLPQGDALIALPSEQVSDVLGALSAQGPDLMEMVKTFGESVSAERLLGLVTQITAPPSVPEETLPTPKTKETEVTAPAPGIEGKTPPVTLEETTPAPEVEGVVGEAVGKGAESGLKANMRPLSVFDWRAADTGDGLNVIPPRNYYPSPEEPAGAFLFTQRAMSKTKEEELEKLTNETSVTTWMEKHGRGSYFRRIRPVGLNQSPESLKRNEAGFDAAEVFIVGRPGDGEDEGGV